MQKLKQEAGSTEAEEEDGQDEAPLASTPQDSTYL